MRSLILVYGDAPGARAAFARRRFPQPVWYDPDPSLGDVDAQLGATTPGPVAVICRHDAPPLFVRLCDLVIRVEFDGGHVVEKGLLE